MCRGGCFFRQGIYRSCRPLSGNQWGSFSEQGPLTGTTAERMSLWKERFPAERYTQTLHIRLGHTAI
jgi:hypothetical protein